MLPHEKRVVYKLLKIVEEVAAYFKTWSQNMFDGIPPRRCRRIPALPENRAGAAIY